MQAKAELLAAIQALKTDQPDGWKGDVRQLLKHLHDLDDPYRDLVHGGNERSGRSARPPVIRPI